MRRSFLFFVCCALLVVAAASVAAFFVDETEESTSFASRRSTQLTLQDLPPGWEQQVDEFISNITRCQGIIGLTASIVVANQTIYAKGFGVQSLEEQTPVDADTLFSVGSTTKAFTSTILGILVDQGKFSQGWDTPVTSILVDFKFADPVMSQYITLRDLLAMKSGLTIHPLLFLKENVTRRDILYDFQYAQSQYEMRTNFVYHNNMISLAGHIAEVVTGSPWEQLVQEYILTPLRMSTSTPYYSELFQSSNWAKPYWLNVSTMEWFPLPEDVNLPFQMVGPAGSMSLSANDAAKWLKMQLNNGYSPDINQSIISATSLSECHRPQFLMQHPPFPRSLPFNKFSNANEGYGFGWLQDNYEGYDVVWHDGEVWGYETEMVLLQSMGIGIFLSQTGSFLGENTLAGIRFFIHNLFLGIPDFIGPVCPPPFSHPARLQAAVKKHHEKKRIVHPSSWSKHQLLTRAHQLPAQILEKHSSKKPKHRHSTVPNDAYVGTYSNAMYGNVTIVDASSEPELLARFFPHHPITDAPISLIFTWEVLTIGLSTWNGQIYNGTLSSPYSYVLIDRLPNAFGFQIQGSTVLGVQWAADVVQPPYHTKIT